MRNQNRNQSNTTYVKRDPIKQVKYIKSTNNFSEVIKEVIDLSTVVRDLLISVNHDMDGDNSIKSVKRSLVAAILDNMPSIETKQNIHFDINLSANKCSFKTDKFISFGWFIKRDREDFNKFEYIFHIIVFGDNDEFVSTLTENGWEVDPYVRR